MSFIFDNVEPSTIIFDGTELTEIICDGVLVWSSFSLLDFEYTKNDDGTFTITDWKGTYNGEPSTEFIVPDDNRIVV